MPPPHYYGSAKSRLLAGLARLKEGEGGQAVRLLEESKALATKALPMAAAYNKAQPSTPAADHAEFDADLRICVDTALTKVKAIAKSKQEYNECAWGAPLLLRLDWHVKHGGCGQKVDLQVQ